MRKCFKKELISVILTVSFLLLISQGYAQQTKLTYWGGGYPKEGIKLIKDALRQFEVKHPNINVEFVSWAWDKYRAKIASALSMGPVPDIIGDSFVRRWDRMEGLATLNEYFEDLPLKDVISPVFLEKGYIKGRYVGVPWVAKVYNVIYNKEMFREAGVNPDVGKELNMWELLDFAQKLTRDDKWGVALLGGRLSTHYYLAVAAEKGAKFMEDDKWVLGEYQTELVEAMRFYQALAQYTPGGAVAAAGRTYEQVTPLFANEECAIFMHGPIEAAKTIEPINPGTVKKMAFWVTPKPLSSAEFLMVTKQSKFKKEAWTLIEYILSDKDIVVPLALSIGCTPTRLDVLDHPLMQEPAPRAQLKQLEHGTVIKPDCYLEIWGEMRTHLFDAVSAVLLNQLSPEQAAQKMLNRMEIIYKEFVGG